MPIRFWCDGAAMMAGVRVYGEHHRMHGALVCIAPGGNEILRLTGIEASSLSFALLAMRDGIGSEREIFMSPIFSDMSFSATVSAAGISIATADGALELDWGHVLMLARALAEAIA